MQSELLHLGPYPYPPYLPSRGHMNVSPKILNEGVSLRLLNDRKSKRLDFKTSPRLCELISAVYTRGHVGLTGLASKCYHQPEPLDTSLRNVSNNLLVDKFYSRYH